MKDMTRPRKTMLNHFREGLIQKHPQVFNVFLIFALISLVVTGAFLVSDIMSFKSNAAQKEHFSGLHQKISKESKMTIKNWQEKGTELLDQGKSVLGLKGTDNTTAKNATDENEVQARNRLAKALEALPMGGNLSHMQNPSPSNSSLTQTAVQPVQAISPTLISSTESEDGSGSDEPVYSYGEGSSEEIEGSQQVEAVASNLDQNQPISNETVLNESNMNEPVLDESVLNEPIQGEPVMNESVLNEPVLNESQINQSQKNTNSSSNISENLPITDLGSDGTRNSSYSSIPRNTNRSFDNLSSSYLAFTRPQANFAASNSTEIQEGLAPSKNGSDVSTPQERSHKNNETQYQNATSNLNTKKNSTQEKRTKNESLLIMPDQRNITSDVSGIRNNNLSANSVSDKSSNITSPQINISLESHPNSALTKETISANNSSSQIQEPKQNQTNNRTKSEVTPARSQQSLPPLLNSTKKVVQNHAGTNSNKVSSGSGSARSQGSKKGQTNSVNRFRTLKVPTPSWLAKA